jgi:kynureninase
MFDTSKETAIQLDKQDELASFKQRFHFPQHNGKDVIYFCGNSLGLQPRHTEELFQKELKNWKELAVHAWFDAKQPWLTFTEELRTSLSTIVGAKENEVTIMNALTVNLHLMLLTFYKPTAQRFKIIMEAGAFPSDQYAVDTQVKHHDLDPNKAIIEIHTRENEKLLRTEDILKLIDEHKDELALVLLGGIHYYTGQLFDIQKITEAAHKVGAVAGWDLAHVAGNVPIQLHDWNVDFAVWCNYKYLNGGPGSVGGAFVHEKHFKMNLNRLAGWWGNDEKIRFKMEKGFIPKQTASGWNVSTAQIFNCIGLKASLQIFDEAGIERIRTKSVQLTNYLEYLLHQLDNISFEIITPANANERGAQLSLFFKENAKDIHNKITEKGIVTDYREPGVIRFAPAPLYCSFEDIYRFYKIINEVLNSNI